jgi:ketosteroid isomerase-like protein
MRFRVLGLILVMVGSVSCRAQNSTVQQEVLDANRSWFDAFVRGDANQMDSMETEDFVFIQDGLLLDKADQIAGVRKFAGQLKQTHTIELHKLATAGDAVIATGFNIVNSENETQRAAFTEVWVRDGGRWRIKQGHYSTMRP